MIALSTESEFVEEKQKKKKTLLSSSLPDHYIRQLLHGVSLAGRDQIIEARSRLYARGERLEIPQVAQGPKDGGRVVGYGLALTVRAKLLYMPSGDPRTDQPGGQTAAQAIELKGVRLAGGCGLGVGEIVWADSQWGRDMVVETTGFVKGDNK